MIRTLLIDDDEMNTKFLRSMLEKYCPLVEIVATANNVSDAISLVMYHEPDLLFLDIEIHDKSGFEVLKAIEMPEMYVIVVSAYDKYAFQAIKHQAVDYLLKPVQIDELVKAYQRYLDKGKNGLLSDAEPRKASKYLSVPNGDHMDVIPFETIEYIEGEGRYSNVYSLNGDRYVSSKSLGELEKLLPEEVFLRVHRTFIINVNQIASYLRTKVGLIVMKNGAEVPISSEKKKEVSDILNL